MKLKAHVVTEMLKQIAAGTITATEGPKDSCDRQFTTSNGWSFVIFDDVGQMDYVDSARSPSGIIGDFDDWTVIGNPLLPEWRDPTGDNPLGRALKWAENSDYVRR